MRPELDLRGFPVRAHNQDCGVVHLGLRQQTGFRALKESGFARQLVDGPREELIDEVDNARRACKDPVVRSVVHRKRTDHRNTDRVDDRIIPSLQLLPVLLESEESPKVLETEPNARSDRLARVTAEKHIVFVGADPEEQTELRLRKILRLVHRHTVDARPVVPVRFELVPNVMYNVADVIPPHAFLLLLIRQVQVVHKVPLSLAIPREILDGRVLGEALEIGRHLGGEAQVLLPREESSVGERGV
mmetsp:Transcript_15866/g.31690  ORF Transcript_15866/g.31690 Transcript_15866/m.31690 type:complete len:246 (-) Transcript_15866:362-1099(-)